MGPIRGGGFGGGRGRGGGGGFGGRGGGRGGGGGGRFQDQGPPDRVIPVGYFSHSSEDFLVCKATIEDVPYFNAPIYFENKEQIGKVDEILGTMKDYYFSVKLNDNLKASSFKPKDEVFIDPGRTLPLSRFTGSERGGGGRGGRGGGRGGGGRGGGRGGGGRGGGFGRGGGRGGGGRGGGFSGGRGGGFGGGRGGGGGFGRGGGGGGGFGRGRGRGGY